MMPPRPIKLMPDYECFPLWWDTAHPYCTEVGNIDPASLGVSAQLVADLNAWAADFDASLDWDDPGGTVVDERSEAAFRARGADLAARLAAELGPTAIVRYAYQD